MIYHSLFTKKNISSQVDRLLRLFCESKLRFMEFFELKNNSLIWDHEKLWTEKYIDGIACKDANRKLIDIHIVF
jgi:hypothetical protein